MASVQRDHWYYVALHCLLLCLVLCRRAAFADKNKFYHTSTLCVKDRLHPLYKKIDGAVLTSESESDLHCSITFQTDSILQKFMLRFERLALDCNDHLYIFDGAHAYGNYKADLSCRDTRSEFGTTFTHSNYVTLKYVTDNYSSAGNGFQLVITAVKQSPVACRDFRCMNSFCISDDLKCDEINHCADNSDETSHASCVDGSGAHIIMGFTLTVFVSIVVTILVVCFVCIISIVICLCRRHPRPHGLALQQQQQQPPQPHPLAVGHPPYPNNCLPDVMSQVYIKQSPGIPPSERNHHHIQETRIQQESATTFRTKTSTTPQNENWLV